ncbi:MAG: TIGR04133 family radical SAM/SPASM protein [Tannerella sp.]|jgi:radical SAM enzyme (rSAM/lipoprotein system)|nr:TIGR04133 family radical SAM/SPASM protein [Tannerella sp.]
MKARKGGLRKYIALEVFRRMRKNEVKLHELRVLFWECTLRCNASCRHCGSDCRASATHPDMPAEDFLRVIDEITPCVNPHRVMVVFTGGEALLRTDIEACGRELCRRGYPWGIVSNGLLFGERLDGLLAAGLHSATISLDGFEEAHNWLRGRPDSFRKALESVRLLTATDGLAWDVVTCVHRKNFDDLPSFRRFLTDMGVTSWRIFTVFPAGRAADLPELQLDNGQFTQLMDFIRDCRREGLHVSYGCEGFLGDYELEVRDYFYHCRAGVHTASILADGSVTGCPSIRANFHQGNIYRDRFMDIWNERFQPFRDRAWTQKGQCADCTLYRYCEGNGMHLYDDRAQLLVCHHKRILRAPGKVAINDFC